MRVSRVHMWFVFWASASLLMSMLSTLHLFFVLQLINICSVDQRQATKPYFNQSGKVVVGHAINMCSPLFSLITVNMKSWWNNKDNSKMRC